jgi:hypothetical protein
VQLSDVASRQVAFDQPNTRRANRHVTKPLVAPELDTRRHIRTILAASNELMLAHRGAKQFTDGVLTLARKLLDVGEQRMLSQFCAAWLVSRLV